MKKLFTRIGGYFTKGGFRNTLASTGRAISSGFSKSWGWMVRNKAYVITGLAAAGTGFIAKMSLDWWNRKDAQMQSDLLRLGYDPNNGNVEGARARAAANFKAAILSDLNALQLSHETNPNNELKRMSRIAYNLVRLTQLLPGEKTAAISLQMLDTYADVAQAGLTIEEDPDNELLIRHFINTYENGTSLDQYEGYLVEAIRLAASNAPLRTL